MTGPVVCDIEGTVLSARERRRLQHPAVGQVILFSRNFESPRQLRELTGQIRALRDPPLLVCVDHEGGRVQRFRTGFTRIGPMAELGRAWDRDVLGACRQARSTGYVLASELRSCGVDLSFAPVLDLDWGRSGVIGDRALHADARVAAMLASHLIQGFALAGMACCGKHFPGHGWTRADSHHEIPVDERPLARILRDDAAPYHWLGIGLASVMPAHVVYPKVDPLPAGFSRRWIEEVLRQRLGFAGAVYSDDLSMAGAGVAGGLPGRARAALEAGCDFILVCNDPDGCDALLEALAWTRGPLFDRRLARLRPRGPSFDPERLAEDPDYQAALSDIAGPPAPAAAG